MMETGPFRPDGNGGLQTIEGGWEEYTNVVFGEHTYTILSSYLFLKSAPCLVDQPAGTGYSYTSTDRYVHELTDVGYDDLIA